MIRGILDACPGIDHTKPVQVYRNLHKPGCDCRVLAIHAAGTIDVERLADGECFRVSGL